MTVLMETGEFAATRQALPRACTLPPRCYTDPDFYAQGVERIFRREWISVGRIDQVAQPGDYFTSRS